MTSTEGAVIFAEAGFAGAGGVGLALWTAEAVKIQPDRKRKTKSMRDVFMISPLLLSLFDGHESQGLNSKGFNLQGVIFDFNLRPADHCAFDFSVVSDDQFHNAERIIR